MTRSMRWAARTSRALAGHIDRLRGTLELLGDRLREAVAHAIGQTVASAAQDAVRCMLAGSSDVPSLEAIPSFERLPPAYWTDAGGRACPTWPDEPQGHCGPTAHDGVAEGPSGPASNNPGRRWGLALAIGCQTAAWWLRHKAGHVALLAAAGVGLGSALAAYVSGPVIALAARFSGSCPGLAFMIDATSAWASALFGSGAL